MNSVCRACEVFYVGRSESDLFFFFKGSFPRELHHFTPVIVAAGVVQPTSVPTVIQKSWNIVKPLKNFLKFIEVDCVVALCELRNRRVSSNATTTLPVKSLKSL